MYIININVLPASVKVWKKSENKLFHFSDTVDISHVLLSIFEKMVTIRNTLVRYHKE